MTRNAGTVKNADEQEKEKQLKARYIDVYGATVGTVLYNEHLKRKEA